MKKEKARQLLTIFSLFMLLVLPTAIVGFNNFSSLVNRAFAKPFQKEEATFLVQTESSANITKGSQFSLKVTASTPKTLPLKHFAAFIEFDKAKVDVKAVQLQDTKQLKVISYQNGFLVFPVLMNSPANFDELRPDTCSTNNTCDFATFNSGSVSFTINGVLLSDLSSQQRPIKITVLGAAETSTVSIWNEKILLPALKLGGYVKNSAPEFLTEPQRYTHEGTQFAYEIKTKDADSDPVTLSLSCPESAFCDKVQKAPEGIALNGNLLTWNEPKFQEKPYEITVYVNDGKSVSTQTFSLKVLQKDTSYFSCTFTPAVSVKILDYRVETPLTIVAESSVDLANATVTLKKDKNVEKTFDYIFTPATKNIIIDKSSKPSLSYKFNEGQYTGTAVFTSTTGTTFTCELTNPTVSIGNLVRQALSRTVTAIVRTVQAQTSGINVGTNNTPTFTSDPMTPPTSGGSSPGVSFVYGTAYSFTLKAEDQDGDPMQHTIVTKPEWAAVAVASSTSASGPSTYSIQFTGTPQAKHAGSNLFSVSINDGYGHYITRTWVINVDYPNNDIPRVTIIEPIKSTTRYQGSPFLLKWEVEDRHQVVSFKIQYTKSLGSASRTTYNNNVSYRTRGLTINTSSIPPGDYYFIVSAVDGFTPPATGSGYTAMIRILPPKPKPTPTPKPTSTPKPTITSTPSITTTGTVAPTTITPTPTATEEPTPEPDEISIQVTSPRNQAQINPADFQTVITFAASKAGELNSGNLSIKLDTVEILDKFTLSAKKGKTITASYKPSVLLEPGIHELIISAKDSKDKTKEVKVSFTILEDTTSQVDSVNFLGFDVPKHLYTLFIAALILIIILVLLPLILYFAFRNSDKENPPPTPRQPVVPVNPNLRSPAASFIQSTPVPQSQASTFQPVRVAQQPTPIPNDIPRVTPKEALANFVAQSPMQEAQVKPQVAPQKPSSMQVPSQPIAQTKVTEQPKVQLPVINATQQQKPVMPQPSVSVDVKKPAPAIVPPKPIQPAEKVSLPSTNNTMTKEVSKPQSMPIPVADLPKPIAQMPKVSTPATIPGKQSATPTPPTIPQQSTAPKPPQIPMQQKPAPTVSPTPVVQTPASNVPVPQSTAQMPQKPIAPTTSTVATSTQSNLPPESPSIPVTK